MSPLIGRPHARQLLQHFGGGALRIDHPAHPPHLALDAAQPVVEVPEGRIVIGRRRIGAVGHSLSLLVLPTSIIGSGSGGPVKPLPS